MSGMNFLVFLSLICTFLVIDNISSVSAKLKPLYKGDPCEPEYHIRVKNNDNSYCARLLYCHPKKKKCLCPPKFKWDPNAEFKDGAGKAQKKSGLCLGQKNAKCREGSDLYDMICKPELKCKDKKRSETMVNPFHGGPVYDGVCG